MAQIEQFFYVSRASDGLTQAEVDTIVQSSQDRNRKAEVTGVLLFSGSHFAQVLEGPADGLAPIVQAILADKRHHDVAMLRHEPVPARCFAGWALRYVRRLGTADLLEHLVDSPRADWQRVERLIDRLFTQQDA